MIRSAQQRIQSQRRMHRINTLFEKEVDNINGGVDPLCTQKKNSKNTLK